MTPVTGVSPSKVKRMWPGGPLRRWSPVRQTGCKMPLADGGFGGSYVCEGCSEPVAGLYRMFDRVEQRESWLCVRCKTRSDETKIHVSEKTGLADRNSPSQAVTV